PTRAIDASVNPYKSMMSPSPGQPPPRRTATYVAIASTRPDQQVGRELHRGRYGVPVRRDERDDAERHGAGAEHPESIECDRRPRGLLECPDACTRRAGDDTGRSPAPELPVRAHRRCPRSATG